MALELKKIFQQTFVSALLSFLTFAFSFLRVYYFSKKLTMEDFAVLSLLLTISAFLMYIFTIGSFQYLFKRSSEGNEARLEALLTSLIVTISVSGVLVAISFVFQDMFVSWLNIEGYGREFFLSIVLTATTSVMMVFLFYHYGLGKNNFQNFLQFMRGSFWIVIALIASLFIEEITVFQLFIILNVCMLFILLLSMPWNELRQLKLPGKLNLSLKPLFNYCLPLLPYFAGVWGIPMIVRAGLNIHEGPQNLAFFTVAFTLMEIIFMFVSTITGTLSPYFFAESNTSDKPNMLYNIMLKYSIICIALVVPFVFIARSEIIELITSPKYLPAADLVPLLLLYPFLRIVIIVFEQVYLKESRTLYLGIVYSVALVAAVIISNSLIANYSIIGAISASLISYGIVFVSLMINQLRHMDLAYLNPWALLKYTALVCISVYALGFLPIHNFIKWLPLLVVMLLGLNYIPVLTPDEKQKILGFLKIKKNG